MRLIDADAALYEIGAKEHGILCNGAELMEKAAGSNPSSLFNGFALGVDVAKGVITTMPTIDAVPVVRCQDCKHQNKAPCPMRLSLNWTEDNDFCAYGEKRDEKI